MRTYAPAHMYAIGEVVSLNFNKGEFFSKLNPFTVEAQMPPVGAALQYRIKSSLELCRRVVAEHQLSAFGSQPAAPSTVFIAPGFDESD